MKRSIIFKSLSVAVVAVGVWGCSSKQIAQKSGNEVYDDLYAQVGETSPAVLANNVERKGTALNQNPEAFEDDRAYSDKNAGTTDYYSEEGGIDSRDYKRNNTDRPGYSDYSDYSDGYRDGVYDSRYNWGNSWNSGFGAFNRFNYGSMYSNWYNPGVTIILGGRNRFGGFYNPYSNFGFYDPFYAYSPFGFGGFNSFGYGGFNDPFYSSFYSPWGYNNYNYFGGGLFNSPRYYSNNNYAYNNSNYLGADRANRNYGPRNAGRNSAGYNDQFTNTAKPRSNADPNMRKGTTYVDPANNAGAYGSGAGGYSARPRGGYAGNTASGNTSTKTDSRGSINSSRGTDGYSTRSRGGAFGTTGQPSNTNSGNARPSASQDNNTYYAKPSRSYSNNNSISNGANSGSNSRIYDNSSRSSSAPASSSWNSNNSSSNSSSFGGSSSRGSSFGSSSSSGSSGSSSGSSSGGSSSSGRSSGGGSRGPR